MKRFYLLIPTFCIFLIISGCKRKSASEEEKTPLVSVKTAQVIRGNIENEASFNGSTVYLKKNIIYSPISGYIVLTNVKFGQQVKKDEVLFEIQTKEGKALQSEKNSGGNVGIVKVPASSGGYINELIFNESGGYVPEGGSLCTITDNHDLMVEVNVPFEYISILMKQRNCKICLPDNTSVSGSVFRILPVVNEANQTQTVLLKPEAKRQLPEHLNLLVKFIHENHLQTLLVSKSSLMTNETQSEFWIMKIAEGNMAVKIPVVKGLENDTLVEIITPLLSENDWIISEGAYGLPDSTLIKR
jgi:hypothetical protein